MLISRNIILSRTFCIIERQWGPILLIGRCLITIIHLLNGNYLLTGRHFLTGGRLLTGGYLLNIRHVLKIRNSLFALLIVSLCRFVVFLWPFWYFCPSILTEHICFVPFLWNSSVVSFSLSVVSLFSVSKKFNGKPQFLKNISILYFSSFPLIFWLFFCCIVFWYYNKQTWGGGRQF